MARTLGANITSVGTQQPKPGGSSDGGYSSGRRRPRFESLAVLTWIAAGLFVVAMLNCSYGLRFTTIPSKRRNWIKFHRTLTNVFYVAIILHVLIRSFGVWTAAVLIIALFLVWRFNPQISERLKTITWPLHKAHRIKG